MSTLYSMLVKARYTAQMSTYSCPLYPLLAYFKSLSPITLKRRKTKKKEGFCVSSKIQCCLPKCCRITAALYSNISNKIYLLNDINVWFMLKSSYKMSHGVVVKNVLSIIKLFHQKSHLLLRFIILHLNLWMLRNRF